MEVKFAKGWWNEIVHSKWMEDIILQECKEKFSSVIPTERQNDYQIRMVTHAGTTVYNRGFGEKWEHTDAFGNSRIPVGNIETANFRGMHSEKLHHHLQRIVS